MSWLPDSPITWQRSRLWLMLNLIGMGLLTWGSSPLWHFHLKPGDLHAAGPGDGLYFFFMLCIPFLVALMVNVGLLIGKVIAAVRSGVWNPVWSLGMIALGWLILAVLIQRLIQIPEGVLYIGA